MRTAIAVAVSAAMLPSLAAAGLAEDFVAALAHDPTWQAAIATRDAGVEARAQGLAGLLPQVSFSGSKGKADTTSSLVNSPNELNRNYDTYNYTLQLRQPIYRARNLAAYEQGKEQEAYAQENLRAARQDLAVRLVSAYGDWAGARAELDAAEERVRAAEVLVRTAERGFGAGDATRVDAETARGRLAQAEARRADAAGQLQAAILAWRQITGREQAPATDASVPADVLARLRLEPARLDDLQVLALSTNGQIAALARSVEVARQEVRKARGDHLPTVDVYAQRSRSQSDTDVTINQRYDTTRYGVQVSIPIFAGGATESAVRQALANQRRAESELEAAKLKLKLQIERDWHSLAAARSSVDAAAKVVQAATLALRAARLGIEAGNASRSDEVNALTQLADGRRDLGQASARGLVYWARLTAAIDRLDEETLRQVDATMAATAVASSEARR